MQQNYPFLEKALSNRWLQNILFWLFYAITPFMINLGKFGSNANMYTDLQFYAECALLGYINIFILLPLFFDKKRYILYLVLLIILVFGYNLISHQISLIISPNLPSSFLVVLYEGIDFFMFVVAFSAARFVRNQFEQNKKINQLEEKKLSAEIDFLKMQINPHLLFNTLNTLYSHSLEHSTETPKMILKLSEIMRYMLYETNEKTVLLSQEINYLTNYVSLQNLRIQGRGEVDFQTKGNIDALKISPMLLISFVENAFKYSMDSLTTDILIKINISVNDGWLNFVVKNNFEQQESIKNYGGLGLNNTKKRLELLYPKKHQLMIDHGENQYIVDLKIKLDE